MPLKQKAVEGSLKTKGFTQNSSHHKYFYYQTKEGKITSVYTYVSHSGREIDDYLIGKMAKQLKLTRPQFLSLIECPLSRDDYESILKKQGFVDDTDPAEDS